MYDSIQPAMSLQEKLTILSDAAKYDVACTSSGVDRKGKAGSLGNSCAAGICHAFAADGRCISLLKILMTNHCAYDCKYCKNRRSNDIPRATFTPQEICQLTMEFYRRNYIEGLFLSSGILQTPDNTMEKICETLRILRRDYHFNGYIHVKAIPGASSELLYSAGLLADRISINMELPTDQSLRRLAPNKTMQNILRPMGHVTQTIAAHRTAIGLDARMDRATVNRHLVNSIFGEEPMKLAAGAENMDFLSPQTQKLFLPAVSGDTKLHRPFAPAGQSTQMIIGAGDETDLQLIRTSQSLYQGFDLKRVFYSGYIPLNEDTSLPALDTPVPLLREHRLYQADWLLRFYGFHAEELLTKDNPYFDDRVDPKCYWALQHPEQFPVEVNTASYDQLLRVPGIGPTGIKKIMSARRYGKVTFEMLKHMHITLKRAQYFITCDGRRMTDVSFDSERLLYRLSQAEPVDVRKLSDEKNGFRQLNLFTDFSLQEVSALS